MTSRPANAGALPRCCKDAKEARKSVMADYEPKSGDTIAYLLQAPIYGIGRVVSVKNDGWYEIRRFDLPGILNESAEDLRIGLAINLRTLLPTHDGSEMLADDWVAVAVPAGIRLATLVHDFDLSQPGVIVRGIREFDVARQQYVMENVTTSPKRIFPVSAFVDAKTPGRAS
jgi:hypothetical protein